MTHLSFSFINKFKTAAVFLPAAFFGLVRLISNYSFFLLHPTFIGGKESAKEQLSCTSDNNPSAASNEFNSESLSDSVHLKTIVAILRSLGSSPLSHGSAH